jgi:hypothetical protein
MTASERARVGPLSLVAEFDLALAELLQDDDLASVIELNEFLSRLEAAGVVAAVAPDASALTNVAHGLLMARCTRTFLPRCCGELDV